MLTHLAIKDLAVVECLALDLEPGLIVLTGETGAGKSILLTALGLALGDRADSGFIRPGADKAEVNLEFSLSDASEARLWLQDNELLDEDDTCLIRRVVTQDGRSRAFVNSRPITLQALQELASNLVEIHGQHAHLHLLKANEQRRLLDEFAGNQADLEGLRAIYEDWKSANSELKELRKAANDREAREELLRFQIDEMEQLEIETLDYAELSQQQILQANVGKILSVGQTQLDALYDGDDRSINALLSHAITGMHELAHLVPEFDDLAGQLKEAQIQVKEVSGELRRRLDRLEADPARLNWLDEKLGDFHRLARKHHTTPQELAEHLTLLRDELSNLEQGSERISELEAQVDALASRYREAAGELTRRRQEAAGSLQTRISDLIRELGMPQGQFLIQIATDSGQEPAPAGWDSVEYSVSANPGLPPRPLAKVASGGELSRISLAIQVAATDSKTVPTLVFDEVDTGIGGGIAEIVGQKLKKVARGRQVFCITHLHQVAAQGDHHLLVEKRSGQDKTQTQVRKLGHEQRRQEIARMLGGVKITDQTLAHAEELLQLAQQSNA
jgi:DNA repair protein RecN (Recombination protein N)